MQRRSFIGAGVVLPSLPFVGSLFASALAPRHVNAATTQRVGTAVDANNGAMLYRERHVETYAGARMTAASVSFTDPAGQRVATKRVRFPSEGFIPEFRFENRRTGHVEACTPVGARRVEVSFREGGNGPVESREIDAPRGALADAGFDRFIEAEWDAMTAGKPLVRPFLVPSRFEFMAFRLRDAGVQQGGKVQRFAMEIDSFLLRLLAPTILIDYERDTRKLARYEGPSNVRDERGDNYSVVITF